MDGDTFFYVLKLDTRLEKCDTSVRSVTHLLFRIFAFAITSKERVAGLTMLFDSISDEAFLWLLWSLHLLSILDIP